jgi:hypothetical protein
MTKTTEQIREEAIRQALSDDILRDREGNDARLGAGPDSDSITALVIQNQDLRDAVKSLTAELTALRSQLSEAQANYEKVWDAAVEWSAWTERKDYHAPEDKTTFINKIKKGKE